jgi:hypothetical protein
LHIFKLNIEIVEGPIERTGAMGKIYPFIYVIQIRT